MPADNGGYADHRRRLDFRKASSGSVTQDGIVERRESHRKLARIAYRDEHVIQMDMERLDEIRVRLAGISDPVRLLQAIFAYAPFGLQVYKADGHCLLTNKAFRDLFGSEPPPEYNVLHDEIAERQGLLGLVKRAFAGESVQTPTFWYDPRDLHQVHVIEGRRVSISITLIPLFGASDVVEHVALVIKDETEETLARERAEAARADAEGV